MNWKLVFQLSLFGLVMALGTVFFIPSSVEPMCWIVIFLVCAYVVSRRCRQKLFLQPTPEFAIGRPQPNRGQLKT
jgi:hypothetical protein